MFDADVVFLDTRLLCLDAQLCLSDAHLLFQMLTCDFWMLAWYYWTLAYYFWVLRVLTGSPATCYCYLLWQPWFHHVQWHLVENMLFQKKAARHRFSHKSRLKWRWRATASGLRNSESFGKCGQGKQQIIDIRKFGDYFVQKRLPATVSQQLYHVNPPASC